METPRERHKRIAKKLEHIQKDSNIFKNLQERQTVDYSSRHHHKRR